MMRLFEKELDVRTANSHILCLLGGSIFNCYFSYNMFLIVVNFHVNIMIALKRKELKQIHKGYRDIYTYTVCVCGVFFFVCVCVILNVEYRET